MADQEDDPECWEDIDEEDLLRRLDNRQKKQEKPKKSVTSTIPESSSIDQSPITVDGGPLKIKFSEGTTEYVAPIKILKRPDKPAQDPSQSSGVSNNSRPLKSLAQREAEYNSARARILGDNCDNSSDVKVVRQPKGPSSNDKKNLQKHPSSR